MRIALLFPHDPRSRQPGIDLVRLLALSRGLRSRGADTHIVAPVARPERWRGLPLLPCGVLSNPGYYDVVKVCYHQAIFLAADFQGPLLARLVRVVDARHPARDRARRGELLRAQEIISRRAQAIAFNNVENQRRWLRGYGDPPISLVTPTGCPHRLPAPGPNPFAAGPPSVIYAGSLSSPRQVRTMNRVAEALGGRVRLHLVGRNKSGLYGRSLAVSPLVIDHGGQTPASVWNYLRWADVGLALAVGPQRFDNDSSKVIHYLRAGLPVICEEPILQGGLVRELGMGMTLPYNDALGLAQALVALARRRPSPQVLRRTRTFMAHNHSWDKIVDLYLDLFSHLAGQGRLP